jgi:hypothetical protein|tara:strand:- start:3062 stop:3385 length:324 start_codon:yes stop_codon:yes gene_type:complete
MELFKESIILTRNYTRYGGDSTSILGLVVDYKGVAYLFSDADNDGPLGMNRLFSITSQPEYVKWLIDNSMDLLEMADGDSFHAFYNDRNVVEGRKDEFIYILDEINK